DGAQRLKEVMGESRIRWVLHDFASNLQQLDSDKLGNRDRCLLQNNEDSHQALHQVLILGNLLRGSTLFNKSEQVCDNIPGIRLNIANLEQRLTISSHSKNSFDGNCGVGVDNKVWRSEMVSEKWKGIGQLSLCHLTSKGVEISDSVDLENWCDISETSSEIRSNSLLEEIDNVNEDVGRGNTNAGDSALGRYRSEQVQSGIL